RLSSTRTPLPTGRGLPTSTGTDVCSSNRHATAACRSSPTFRAGSWAASTPEESKICVMRRLLLVGLLATVAACAPKRVPAPVAPPAAAVAPRFPDFLAPTVPTSFAGTAAEAGQERGWQLLQAGDLKGAEREFETALKTSPAFYPAEAALGYVELAREDAKGALPHFDRALEHEKSDLSSLVGRGRSLLALN